MLDKYNNIACLRESMSISTADGVRNELNPVDGVEDNDGVLLTSRWDDGDGVYEQDGCGWHEVERDGVDVTDFRFSFDFDGDVTEECRGETNRGISGAGGLSGAEGWSPAAFVASSLFFPHSIVDDLLTWI